LRLPFFPLSFFRLSGCALPLSASDDDLFDSANLTRLGRVPAVLGLNASIEPNWSIGLRMTLPIVVVGARCLGYVLENGLFSLEVNGRARKLPGGLLISANPISSSSGASSTFSRA